MGQRREPLPQAVDLWLEVVGSPAVVDDEIGLGETILARGLSRDAGPGIGLVETAMGHQPLHLGLHRHVDDDATLQTLPGILGEQGDVEYDDVAGRSLLDHATVHLATDRRMHDGIEGLQRFGVGEDDVRQYLTLQRTIGGENLGAETFRQFPQHIRARQLDLACDGVGVDDDRATRRQAGRDGGFAGTDSTRESNQNHGDTLRRSPTGTLPLVSDRRRRRSPNHPALRPVPVQDETGEMSWPLVERRRSVRSEDPSGHLAQLSRANELLLSLQKMAVTLSSSLDADEVVQRGVENARRVVSADTVIVALLDQADGTWSVVAGPDDVIGSASLNRDSPALRCIESERPVEASTGTIWAKAAHGVYQSLRARGQTLGFIAGEWADGHRPTVAEREAIVGVADALALALDNARIFARLAERVAHDERSRVARELHDRVSGSLAAIGFELDDLARGVDEAKRTEIMRVREHVGSTISDIRGLLDDLRADRDGRSLDATSVKELADRMSRRSGVEVAVRHGIDSENLLDRLVSDGSATEIHLMIREALLNVERHARARRVDIDVSTDDEELMVVIRDDGRGFDPDLRGHGISGMRERAEWIGASLHFRSGSDGTTVTIRLPLGDVGS